MDKETLTTFEAARVCRTSYTSIIRWIKSGKIKAFTTPGGHRRILKKDLTDFMVQHNIPIHNKSFIQKKRVLIVIDNKIKREEIANLITLLASNFDVVVAEDGFNAGVLVTQFNPDIIILDLIKQENDGLKICSSIKNNPLTQDIKIIVLTGNGKKENIHKAYRCGANKVLAKPIKNEVILKNIQLL